MPVNEQEQAISRALTFLADIVRKETRGSRRDAPAWDTQGTFIHVGKTAGLPTAERMALIARAASDHTARTPAVISDPKSIHARERIGERPTQRNVLAQLRCNDCGRPEEDPIHADDHAFERLHAGRVPAPQNLRDIVAEAAATGGTDA